MLQQETVNSFIIEMSLIAPIEKILKQIENGEMRDCDVKWLENKFKGFADFAAQTLGITPPALAERTGFTIYNPYVQNYYTERFTTLLNYFKSLNND